MCTALFALGVHPSLVFLLAFNRDEFLDRSTEPAQWWKECPDILAGRDNVGGGTWLGINRSGRFAFLTNFREPYHEKIEGPSRGVLPVLFLNGTAAPLQFLEEVDAERQNGFNLVVGDLSTGEAAYLTNRDPSRTGPLDLKSGIYGLSNAVLDAKWPKVDKAREPFEELLRQPHLDRQTFLWERVFDDILLQGEKVADSARLPATGVPEDIEHKLSSILIEPTEMLGKAYGTRSQTVVAAWSDGTVEFRERSLDSRDPTCSSLQTATTYSFEFRVAC